MTNDEACNLKHGMPIETIIDGRVFAGKFLYTMPLHRNAKGDMLVVATWHYEQGVTFQQGVFSSEVSQ